MGRPIAIGKAEGGGRLAPSAHALAGTALAVAQLLRDGLVANGPLSGAIGVAPWAGAVDLLYPAKLFNRKGREKDRVGLAVIGVLLAVSFFETNKKKRGSSEPLLITVVRQCGDWPHCAGDYAAFRADAAAAVVLVRFSTAAAAALSSWASAWATAAFTLLLASA